MEPTTPTGDDQSDDWQTPSPVTPESPASEPVVIRPDEPASAPAPQSSDVMPAAEAAPGPDPAPIDPLHPAVIQSALNPLPSFPAANDGTPPPDQAVPVITSLVPPATAVVGGVIDGSPLAAPAAESQPPAISSRRKLSAKTLLIALAAVVVVGAGSAAAYAGIIVPNKPANVLKAAFQNALQQKQANFSGTLQGGPATGTGIAYKATFSGAENLAAKATDFQLNLTVSGVSFPVEVRLVDQNVYLKVGDISSLTSLIGSVSPDLSSVAQSLSAELSNKWIEFDSTLLDEAGASCALNANWSFSKADIQLLENQYGKDPFTTIQSASSDTLDGKKVEKLVLSLNDDKLAKYTQNLNGLSVLKTIRSCEKSPATTSGKSSLADGDNTPLTIWVNKSTKQIVQVASQSTAADAKKSNINVSATVTVNYGKVSITAPSGAEPATQFIASLESSLGASGAGLADLLGSTPSGGSASVSGQAQDAKRESDMLSLQTQFEAYFSLYGNYPSLSEMNSASWRQANMPGLDANALKDPNASSETLAAKPAANVYAYQVTTSSGASCESNAKACTKYTLTATLSNGQAYSEKNLD